MEIVFIKAGFALVISFLVTFYFVPLCIRIAQRLQFIDEPDGDIKKHAHATPYLGGVAIYLGYLTAFCLTIPFANDMLLFFAGSTLLLFVGLIDDLLVLRPAQKFFGQILATLCFLKAGIYLKGQFFTNFWNIPISALWILVVINAFNLVDVMDGLSTLLAIGATCSFLVLAVFFNMPNVIILLSCLIGPLVAFLWYNKPTAKIYMGDAGSLFIGGYLASIPFFFNWGIYTSAGYLAPIIILAVPLLEVSALILIRTYKKIPFYKGSPDHFSIYLQQNGWSKRSILLYVALLSIVLGLVSFLFTIGVLSWTRVCLSAALFITIWVAFLFIDFNKN